MSKRALAVLVIGCGVLGLQSLPTAVAAKSGAGPTLTSTSEAVSTATRKAERAAAKAENAPPAPPPVQAPAPPPAAHPRHAQAEALAGAPSTGPASRREERAHRREAQTQQAASASGSGAGVAPVSGEAAAGEVEALARKSKKGSEEKKRAKKEHKEKAKGKKGSTPPEEETGTQGSGAEGAEAEGGSGASVKSKTDLSVQEPAQAAVAAALSLPAATPTATSGTGSASITSSPAARAGLDASATTHRRGGKARRHGRKRAAPAATTVVATPVGIAATTPALGGATHAASATPAKRAAHPSTQPALVKTLTKIVGVVPTPVRILIGALIALALLLGVRSLLSGVRTRRLLRQRGQLLEDVGLLQAALLPSPPSRLGPVPTSVAYRPADGPGAGGDFYDVFALANGEIAVIVGDVSGHGREALPHTALLRFTVRAYLEAGMPPRRALQTAGEVLERQLGGSFATVLAATYNPRERKLTYASAGHPPPVVLGEDASALAMATACSAPPIGTGVRTGTRETVVSVPGPARLCFHTDGVTEARVAGDLFGFERLAATLAELEGDADAAALLAGVVERTDARPDDMAACLLRALDGEGGPAVVLEQLELGRNLVVPAERARVERFLADCGVAGGETRALLDAACERLEQVSTVLLQLRRDGGRTVATLLPDNVIHTPALAMAGAS